jgi:hypothetical protein
MKELEFNLHEEVFFFMYNLSQPRSEPYKMTAQERKFHIYRFIEQKEKEHEAIEAERNKAKSRR